MSHAGCPYDNAPMERYFNTLKNDYFYLHRFRNEYELDQGLYLSITTNVLIDITTALHRLL